MFSLQSDWRWAFVDRLNHLWKLPKPKPSFEPFLQNNGWMGSHDGTWGGWLPEHYTLITLSFCTSRFAPWRRRQACYQIPCTSSTPSAGHQQAQWFKGWPARPQLCDFTSWTTCGDMLCHVQTQDDFQSLITGEAKHRKKPWEMGERRSLDCDI